MVNFHFIFSILGYTTKKQQRALFCLVQSCNSFSLLPWRETPPSLNENIFSDAATGIDWLVQSLNTHYLLSDFHKTLFPPKNGSIRYSLFGSSKSLEKKGFKALGLFQESPWPIRDEVGHVILLGEMEEVIRSRVKFMRDFRGNLYYLSNPRGLFNHEGSLASILAEWFELEGAEEVIQAVLNQHIDSQKTNKNWIGDLSGLKDLILKALCKEYSLTDLAWPQGKGHYYYEALSSKIEGRENLYETAAKIEGRESLAGWPTSIDMLNLYLKAERESGGRFQKVNLVPVLAVGPGKPATMKDCFNQWIKLHKLTIPNEALVVIVSGNPITHSLLYSKAVIESALKPDNTQFTTIIVGPASKKLNKMRALSEFSKCFYERRPRILQEMLVCDLTRSCHAWYLDMKFFGRGAFNELLRLNEPTQFERLEQEGTFESLIESLGFAPFLFYFKSI